jgi:hypothetical protein
VNDHERTVLLERVERESATVGVDIPDEITVQGEPVELRAFVLEVKGRDTVPPGEEDRVEQAKKNLRRERLQRRQRLEREEMSYEEGERLVESIAGIDRALNALENLGRTDLEAEARREEKLDERRWMNFLQQVLGEKDGGPGSPL